MTGEESRPCWQGDPEMLASLPQVLGPMVPPVDITELPGGDGHMTESAGGATGDGQRATAGGVAQGHPQPHSERDPTAEEGRHPVSDTRRGDPSSAHEEEELDAAARARLGRLVEAPRIDPARRLVSTAELLVRRERRSIPPTHPPRATPGE
jgi:hypothetical protein